VADPAAFLAPTQDLREGRRAGRDEIVLIDGRVVDGVDAPLFVEGGYAGYAWYFRDVTAHKRAEAELTAAAARCAGLAHTLQRSLLPRRCPISPAST
jgi:hypothetical protein